MPRRPPEDERDVLVAVACLVADTSDLSDAEVDRELRELGIDPDRAGAEGAALVHGFLDSQRLAWRDSARDKRADRPKSPARRPGPPRPRQLLLKLVAEHQRRGTRMHAHKLEAMSDEDLEAVLLDADRAEELDRHRRSGDDDE